MPRLPQARWLAQLTALSRRRLTEQSPQDPISRHSGKKETAALAGGGSKSAEVVVA
jgi:hypothetical protein